MSEFYKFKKAAFPEFPDIPFFAANLFDLFQKFEKNGVLDYWSQNKNNVVVRNVKSTASLKRTTVYFSGSNNAIMLEDLSNVQRLDIACIKQSKVSLAAPKSVRGLSIAASHNAKVNVGKECLIAGDVLLYASNVHAVYDVQDGTRRQRSNIEIGRHVWLGQGTRILTGARVGQGSIIGAYSVLAGKISNNCAAAGNPCRTTTENVCWTNSSVGENYYSAMKERGKNIPDHVRMTDNN